MAKGGGYAGGGGNIYPTASGKSGGSASPIYDRQMMGQLPGGGSYNGMPDLFGVSFMYGKDKYSLLVTKEGYVELQTPKGMYMFGPDGQLQKGGAKGGSIDNKVGGLYKNKKGAPLMLAPPQGYNQLEGQVKGPMTQAGTNEPYDWVKNGGSAVPAGSGGQKISNNTGIESKLSPTEKYARDSAGYYKKQQSGSPQAANAGRMKGLPPSELEFMANSPANGMVM